MFIAPRTKYHLCRRIFSYAPLPPQKSTRPKSRSRRYFELFMCNSQSKSVGITLLSISLTSKRFRRFGIRATFNTAKRLRIHCQRSNVENIKRRKASTATVDFEERSELSNRAIAERLGSNNFVIVTLRKAKETQASGRGLAGRAQKASVGANSTGRQTDRHTTTK